MLLTKTDIIIYSYSMYIIETKNVYEDIKNYKELLDFSNYPNKSKYYDNLNRLMVEKMKDERWGVPIKGVVGLKPKLSTSITENNHKGILTML